MEMVMAGRVEEKMQLLQDSVVDRDVNRLDLFLRQQAE
jgi:hypothetical protein